MDTFLPVEAVLSLVFDVGYEGHHLIKIDIGEKSLKSNFHPVWLFEKEYLSMVFKALPFSSWKMKYLIISTWCQGSYNFIDFYVIYFSFHKLTSNISTKHQEILSSSESHLMIKSKLMMIQWTVSSFVYASRRLIILIKNSPSSQKWNLFSLPIKIYLLIFSTTE